MKKYIGEIGLILIAIIWGSGFVGTKFALDGGFTPIQIMTLRFFISSILLNIIFFKRIKKNINKDIIKKGSLLGVFLFIAFAVQTFGLLYTTPSKNAFITAANVVIVPFIGYIIYKRKLDKIGVLSSIITLIGIGILSLESNFSVNFGDFLTLICAFGFAGHIFFTSEFAVNKDPIILTSIQFSVAFILSLVVQVFIGEVKVYSQPSGYLGVLYLALFSTTIAFLMQTICQKKVSGTKTAIILSTEAVFGTLFSIILLNEQVTLKMIVGSLLIFASIIMAETKLSFLKKEKHYIKELDCIENKKNIEEIDTSID